MCVTAAHPENPRLNCHEGRGPTFTSALLDGGWISWHHQCVFFTPICNYGGSLNRYIYMNIQCTFSSFCFPMWLLKSPHLTYHWHIGLRYHCLHLCLSLSTVLAWLLKCFTEIIFWGSIPCTSQYMCTLQYVMYCDCQNWIELFFWISEPF